MHVSIEERTCKKVLALLTERILPANSKGSDQTALMSMMILGFVVSLRSHISQSLSVAV